ncbi:unnamed protein product [Arabis nemorensis]|uniref:C2H2-type domain-containing protein n=1 Tax=Arabis nemorensis TaxID=586526 RepID=A0A565AJQ1_9BRAS|nr:unnamed protein product [Arabis nemorensis]
MEEIKHQCKLCWKSFLNGRALGGHMRSHLLLHPLPAHPESASSSMAQDRESETESSKKPTRKRSRLNRRSINVSSRHQQSDEEKSETAADLKIMKPRSSQELSHESCTEQEPMSSVSDAETAEEDVAFMRDLRESVQVVSGVRWAQSKPQEEERSSPRLIFFFDR